MQTFVVFVKSIVMLVLNFRHKEIKDPHEVHIAGLSILPGSFTFIAIAQTEIISVSVMQHLASSNTL